ncbi:MAG TPA: hypothetical protein VFC87_08295 [Perlabentimonas sp.]|nr:hypothetical protein [Bacteroidales bacterium]MDD4673138.1 hypothetical protein [Bacteroidales bacterium]MDY0348161.1 hypothetical protein [Tenuifilaceae bacterium]HZJ74790.1 hypothetical protein [Perlabentimonas sp.]
MKTIYCTCNVSVLEALVKKINQYHVDSYQIIEQVMAHNSVGDNRLNTAVWPGYNSSIIMQITDTQNATQVMNAIREFNKNAFNQNELVIATMWTVDDFCCD